MNPTEQLLADINAFLKRSGMTATAFGWNALKDPAFVSDLRAGREPRWRTVERARDFMRSHDERASA